jgi:hypothetical protein
VRYTECWERDWGRWTDLYYVRRHRFDMAEGSTDLNHAGVLSLANAVDTARDLAPSFRSRVARFWLSRSAFDRSTSS